MEEKDGNVEYVVLNWPGVAYKIAAGVGFLLTISLIFVMFNWKELVHTYREEFHPVNCTAVQAK
jgi:hypothetical protein